MSSGPGRETISVCMIVMNEEQRLPAALASVSFCDELVVVDSGSRDSTREIARAAGATVVEHPWAGFSVQRNVALDHATSEWVLELDADERITPQLAEEIQQFLISPPADVAVGVLPLSGWFLGRLLRPSMKYPHYRTRLFRRAEYRHDETRQVHEGLWPRGRAWVARGDIEHMLAGTPSEALADWWRYARLEASHAPPLTGLRDAADGIALRPLLKLGYRIVVDAGWRDGPQGLVKVALDCSSDAVVSARRLRNHAATGSAAATSAHFGRQAPALGSVRVAAVAAGATEAAHAVRWLRAAYEAGADVALVTDASPPAVERWLHVVALRRIAPIAVMRGADVANQARPVDAFVPFGARARRCVRLLPTTVRGRVGPIDSGERAVDAVAAVHAATRTNPWKQVDRYAPEGAATSTASDDMRDATSRPATAGAAVDEVARSARLLFSQELADGTVSEAALDVSAVRSALRSRPVPPKPLRIAALVQRKRGRLDYQPTIAEPLDGARRAVLGAAAEGMPRFLVRVDEFPHYLAWDEPGRFGTEGFRRFHSIMAGAGVPYLIAVAPRVSRAPLDPAVTVSRPLGEDETAQLHMVAREGATIGLHGLDHRTRFVHPRRHSELCGLDVARAAARIDESLAELARAGVARPEVFVPPFNRFDAAHYPLLAARFPVVCGGPETIGTLGFHRTPLWRDGAVYLPSYAPLYGPARVVLPAAREMIERRQALWAPITLHWGWEADEDWHALGELARAIAPVTASWEPFIALARRERAA